MDDERVNESRDRVFHLHDQSKLKDVQSALTRDRLPLNVNDNEPKDKVKIHAFVCV